MEICRMDKRSHFELGMNSQQMHDANYNFGNTDSSDMSALHSLLTPNETSVYREYQKNGSDNNYKRENPECKQESFMNNINENSNYGSEHELNESFQYAYNPISPLYTTDTNSTTMSSAGHSLQKNNSIHQHRMGPYHISSTKNQLPSWYNPPNTCYAQQPSFFQHQYPYNQGSFLGSEPEPMEHSMRNMIHLTSR